MKTSTKDAETTTPSIQKEKVPADTLSPQTQRIVNHINTFVNDSLEYAIIPDCVDITQLPSSTDDIYATNSKWNPIDFTESSKRYMRKLFHDTHVSCHNLLAALKSTFVTSVIDMQMILSEKGDKRQKLHYDLSNNLADIKPRNKRNYYYSVIVAICPNTRLYVGKNLIKIPIGSMLIFRGDTLHAGAAYSSDNHRFFISIHHKLYPTFKTVGLEKCSH